MVSGGGKSPTRHAISVVNGLCGSFRNVVKTTC